MPKPAKSQLRKSIKIHAKCLNLLSDYDNIMINTGLMVQYYKEYIQERNIHYT